MFQYIGTMHRHVLTSTEARNALPAIGEQIAREGLEFEPVLFGSHRKAVGAIVPVALLDRIELLIEDIATARLVEERLAEGAGTKSMAEYARELGLDVARFE